MSRALIQVMPGALLLVASVTMSASTTAPPMVVVNERDMIREEPAPHGNHGSSTAYRISDAVPKRTMEFRKRILHVGSAIGLHVLSHDEVYYILDGEGTVESDGARQSLKPGMAAYLYTGANVAIRQTGSTPLTLIIAYPLPRP